ncbi:DUF3466 family protein [bacterium AH-315-K20]|nr:DUF3466 family protein [bacterium AH-315-K20]
MSKLRQSGFAGVVGAAALLAGEVSGQAVTLELIGSGGRASDLAESGMVTYERWENDKWSIYRYEDGVGHTAIDPGDWWLLGRKRINSAGQIAFSANNRGEGATTMRYTDGVGLVDLNTIGADSVLMMEMNEAGDVVGQMYSSHAGSVAFLYTDSGGLREAGFVRDAWITSIASSINDNGQIAGSYQDATGAHAIRYSDAEGTTLLGSFGGRNTVATAMNSNGDVVGWSDTPGDAYRAFLYTDESGLIDLDLGTGNREPVDINDNQWIVAYGYEGPWLWTPETSWLTLESLLPDGADARLVDITSINNAGQIVGMGRVGDSWGTFRLTINSVPGPGSVWVMAGAGGLCLCRRREGGVS